MAASLGGVFCDDIRHEIGGKISLIGCYSEVMLVGKFPITLPKLCASVRAITPADEPFKTLKIFVLKDDEVLVEGEIPCADLPKIDPAVSNDGSLFAVNAQFVFSPLEINGPCGLRVRAEVNGDTIRGLGLRIEEASSDQDGLFRE